MIDAIGQRKRNYWRDDTKRDEKRTSSSSSNTDCEAETNEGFHDRTGTQRRN